MPFRLHNRERRVTLPTPRGCPMARLFVFAILAGAILLNVPRADAGSKGGDVHLGAAYTLAGRATEAVACLEEAVETGQPTNRMDPFTLVSLGRAYLSAGAPGRRHRTGARSLGGVPRADHA